MTCEVFKMSLLLSLFKGILSTNQDRQQPPSFGSKLLTFPQPLGKNHFLFLLWNCGREKKWSFAQHYGSDRLWNGKEQEQIHGPVAFPYPGDSPGQHGKRKLHAAHIRRKHTNYIRYFQNTKNKLGSSWSCLIPLGNVIIPAQPECETVHKQTAVPSGSVCQLW